MYATGLFKVEGRDYFYLVLARHLYNYVRFSVFTPSNSIHLNQKGLEGRVFARVQLLSFTIWFSCRFPPAAIMAQ